MYLPPQEYQPQPRKECADAPPLASHSITLPTRGLIMRMMRRKTKTSRTTTGLNDGTPYKKRPYGWIQSNSNIDGKNRFIFFLMPPGPKWGGRGSTVEFELEYNRHPLGCCAHISDVVRY
eukprot:1308363-Prymnesium_polylepis.1